MSKTIRRKNRRFPKWLTQTYTRVNGYWQDVPVTGKKLDQNKAIFYSDKGVGDNWGVPKWFRKDIEREKRAKDKMILRDINSGNYEDYVFPVRKKDVMWEWW